MVYSMLLEPEELIKKSIWPPKSQKSRTNFTCNLHRYITRSLFRERVAGESPENTTLLYYMYMQHFKYGRPILEVNHSSCILQQLISTEKG